MDACSQSLELSSHCGMGLGAGAMLVRCWCTVLCIVTGTDDSLRERGALVRYGVFGLGNRCEFLCYLPIGSGRIDLVLL